MCSAGLDSSGEWWHQVLAQAVNRSESSASCGLQVLLVQLWEEERVEEQVEERVELLQVDNSSQSHQHL